MKKKPWLQTLLLLTVAAVMMLSGCQGISASGGIATANTAAGTADSSITDATAQSTGDAKPDGAPPGAPPDGGQGGVPGGGQSSQVEGTALYTVDNTTESKSGQTYTSTTQDENAVKVTNGGSLALTNATVNKSGGTSSEDSSNFYGLNAGVLAEANSTLTIKDSTITTDSEGSNGAFATGEGATLNLENVTIMTTKNSSRGLDVTNGGTIAATNVDITTIGAHCAAIASDRGGGTETVNGGTMKTAGEGSPGIYSTANITVNDADITATGSEAAVIEGKNSITLNNVTITGSVKRGVMLYQSTSGDAEVGTSCFTMNGGSLTALQGPLFYITNTEAVVDITNATLTQSSGTLISASKDSWGTEGSNGGKVTFTAHSQTLDGNVLCDSIGSVTLNLTEGSALTGAVDEDNTAGTMALSLDSTSTWNVTGTSYLTAFTDSDSTLSNIKDNGNMIYYDVSDSANSWLGGKTITLSGGGMLTPAQ